MNATFTLDDIAVGTMKMITVDGRRVCLVRTRDGLHAIDQACPHEGYGLTQGELDGDLVTCAWHNWKFRVTDGTCVQGEESVQSHHVTVADDGAVQVSINRPDPAERRPQLVASLRRGIERDYTGQVARDVVRLLQADANPGELIWEAVAHGAPRAEFGWGHSIASATDCLSMIDLYEGDQRALPIVQGIKGIAESERGRPVNRLPDPAPTPDATAAAFRLAIEAEQILDAQACVLAAIERGDGADDLRPWFSAVVSDHHLSYGHGAIYTQKAFELLDMIGWHRAATVLPHLVPTLVYGTREDKLPYMRPLMKALAGVDLEALARCAGASTAGEWSDDGTLGAALLGDRRTAPVDATVDAIRRGASVDHVLDVVVRAVSERMLRYDVAGEFDFADDFGWLDITHGLTSANAVRWHHRLAVEHGSGTSPDLLRLVLFTAFLAQWTGRHEWHTRVGERHEVEPLGSTLGGYAAELQRQSMLDGTTAFIVHAHAVKTSRAAALEAERSGSTVTLDATARFLAAPKLERFVAATVTRSIDFLNGRTQRP
ncbi:MAG TPA: Rieske 2Fe-2S domain-containing protein [Ilumatobacteraceae bacterium]|nr:Rieske 2Fe-2S domain-containing protein [Ilumatobacteraceae bacterium]